MHRYLGQGFSEKLGELAGLPPEEREVISYGLEYLLVGIFGLALMLLIGLAFDYLWETVAVLCCWVPMRVFAGGAHCTALWRCTIINGMAVLTVLSVTGIAVYLFPVAAWIIGAVSLALLSVGLWAPINSERPINDPLRRQQLRRSALFFIVLAGSTLLYTSLRGPEHWHILAAAGATGLALGGVMISPIAFRLIRWLDQKLESFSIIWERR
jgi:accessory gene regulator B